ncbi:MAG: acyl-CoA desaturase [Pyrinomonadaceae bacterium]|nr:acyl-CoA desaturase [Pyrinomonadaceae bacterium]
MDNVVEFKLTTQKKINWSTTIAVALFHIAAIPALFMFSWTNLLVAVVIWWIAGSLGIGLGYHRLLTHKGFKAPRWVENTLAVFGALAVQAGPLAWVTTHRIHHAFTETDKDPHSPRGGVIWSHIGWILRGDAQMHNPEYHERYSPDLVKNPFLVKLDKYYWVPSAIVGIALFAFGGIGMVLWGIAVRTVWGWHATWLVNSATHLWGTQRFNTGDDSRNNGLIAFLSWGEGWHNNHHAYPRSARHGLKWYEFDFNWIQIWALDKLGVISDVYEFKIEEDVKPLKRAA